ncbi:TonB-dependent receptor [Nitrosospira sp. Nsp1]|uniref:TonB-dependent receptor n=1 Tax=Nitrosospira sp. Nsp1 TaxID=136547 RepID=UPI00088B1FE2|nr:TonB-dependent receptor [Nitrosospira sp. Nsp1]SCX48162.1 iron complex outermembrane recepter protein [Nitrosospira sp. Nsp1]
MKPNIKLKSMPFALASLLCVSSVWATNERGSQAKDEVEAELAPIKNPLPTTPVPVRSTGTKIAQTPAGATEKQVPTDEPAVKLPEMTIGGKVKPISRQTEKERYRLPQTTESMTREKLDSTVNLMATEDAIKYMPSIQVRSRYIGDTNAPVGMRTSGTSASARNLIYADGILLSSLLGNNNSNTGSPRWNTVSPAEIERIDIMYGPFSAAYAGNSIGGVINITTRMPDKFEVGADAQSSWQTFNLYGTKETYDTQRYSGNIGHRYNDLSFRFDYSHLDAHSQPITFATALNSATAANSGDTVVTGAFAGANATNAPNQTLGAGNINHTVQDNFKWKWAYDITPTIKIAYTLGMWQNNASSSTQSYLRDAAGNLVQSGFVNIGGRRYNLSTPNSPTFAANQTDQTTWSHGMNLRSNTGGKFDWELVGSVIDLGKDTVRAPTVDPTLAFAGNAPGRITSLTGSGWHTADAKGIWRPGVDLLGYHEISFGFHHDLYTLKNPVFNTSNWQSGGAQGIVTNSTGKTQTEGYWIQDAWDFHEDWNFTVGGRLESWHAYDGVNTTTVNGSLQTINQANKSAVNFSPKGKLTWSPMDRVKIGAAIGQAYRYATASELFQTTTVGTGATAISVNGNPNLRSEDALASELSVEYFPDKGRLRLSLFQERIKNAIFSQTGLITNPATGVTSQATFISNVGEIDTYGIEVSGEKADAGIKGLDILGNFTWVDSRINSNHDADAAAAALGPTAANPNAAIPSTGKRQPRLPTWRANAIVTYRANEKLTASVSVRYSSGQFGQLNNSDTNGFAYTGITSYVVADLIAKYKITKQLTAIGGINNVNNDKYWIFHPFPQRTFFAQLKFNY